MLSLTNIAATTTYLNIGRTLHRPIIIMLRLIICYVSWNSLVGARLLEST